MDTNRKNIFRASTIEEARTGARRSRIAANPKPHDSPFFGLPANQWAERTRALLRTYPLTLSELTDVVLLSWIQILNLEIGGFRIGVDIFPSPQSMGSFLHELIPLNLGRRDPTEWRREIAGSEKDLVCMSDPKFSMEIKTSSDKNKIFGNRSFAQETASDAKKVKTGYYLAVNFTKFGSTSDDSEAEQPYVRLVRFGWLDHSDWSGQVASSGQQSSLSADVENNQLLVIYSAE
jgi:ScaI restriction endonuclease